MAARGAHRRVVASYRRYEYNDDLSEGLSVIDDTSTMTTWVKGYQLSTIRVQWRSEWRVISYWRYEYNDDLSEGLSVINDTTNLSEGLPVINDTSTMTTWVKGYQLSTIRPTWVKGCQLSTIRVQKWPVWLMICVVDDLCERSPMWSIYTLEYLPL